MVSNQKELKKLIYEHADKWASCTRCPLGLKKNGGVCRKILYRGKLPAKYLFIGDAPSTADSVLGIPLTGEAGNIFDRMLKECFVTNYAVTNAVACFPVHDTFVGLPRQVKPEEYESCRPRLNDFVELCSPSFYISLGKFAKQNPPDGVVYNLHLDHPLFILRNGGHDSLVYRRNRHNLRNFIQETR
jgi:uracil-DNA glycosylase family 4